MTPKEELLSGIKIAAVAGLIILVVTTVVVWSAGGVSS
jgi:hypothetical protein